ncbi:two-component sensor histidine kinase [Sporanaerobium hydrogeniformans]|uniref:Two-component sensor histidine kinase n=1 Tax=Sporanaerobium hydrogeniformans TaxID=3072179 RepID=A0AC61DCV7_9FIRM|nr:HAMP domain-containing sensor histidine kinase [Sporanaerobium hydrogeniformans]PHV70797.1 two-component sensor histidine kinase [Sporanaerobium hydrogeniformans]
MGGGSQFIVGILILLLSLIGLKLFKMQQALKGLNKQLETQYKTKDFSRLEVTLGHKEVERLGENLNHYLKLYNDCEARSKETEMKLKRTIANMSHDLRTPLTSILGYIQLLREDEVSIEEKKKFLEVTQKKGKSLQKLLNDFFELSVVESVDYELHLKGVNVNNLVRELLFSYYDDFVQKQIYPEFLFPDYSLWVLGEEEAMIRVIENLIGNVLKHAKGRVTIQLDEDKDKVYLKVINEARGLKQEIVDKLFDRFYKADEVRVGKGSGLGLCIAKGLMEKMEGSIEAYLKEENLVMKCMWQINKESK